MEEESYLYNSPRMHIERMFSLRLHGIVMLGSCLHIAANDMLYVEVKMLRGNLEPFVVEPGLLKNAADILNRNARSTFNGRFVADFVCNTIKFIFKAMLVSHDESEMKLLLYGVASDMKHRLQQNLLNMLLYVGEVFYTFEDSGILRRYLAAQQHLVQDFKDFIKEDIKFEVTYLNEYSATPNIEVVYTIESNAPKDDEIAKPKTSKQKENEYVKEGGYFRVEGHKVNLKTQTNKWYEKIVVKTPKFPNDPCTKYRIENEMAIVEKIGSKPIRYLPTYIKSKSSNPDTIYMKWTTNYTLKDTINNQPFSSIHRRLKFMIESCKALLSLHKRNIVHRDVKPSNLLWEYDDTVRIIDFAESWDTSTGPYKFKRGSTMPYAAPYFVNDKLPVNQKSDGWSFGMLMYEIFEGRPPVHYLKLLNGDVVKNLPKFTPIFQNRPNQSGAMLIHRKVRELAGMLLTYDNAKRPNLLNVEKILCRLSKYLDDLIAIDAAQTPSTHM